MSRIDNLDDDELAELLRRVAALEKASPLSNTSVERGRLRMYDGSELLIEDSNLTISGIATVDGQFVGTGTFHWTGPADLEGSVGVKGNMTVSGGGKIVVSGSDPLTLGLIGGLPALGFTNAVVAGVAGGLRVTGGNALLQVSGSAVAITIDGVGRATVSPSGLGVTGDFNASGAKMFRMPHPLKEGWQIQHGSTESPVSGTEYWGEATVDESGETAVMLPDYFETLNKQQGRAVLVTGRGFAADWTDIVDGAFTVTGPAGKRFSWLVKAERFGGDFVVESLAEEL